MDSYTKGPLILTQSDHRSVDVSKIEDEIRSVVCSGYFMEALDNLLSAGAEWEKIKDKRDAMESDDEAIRFAKAAIKKARGT